MAYINGLQMAGFDPNHLVSGMILQVRTDGGEKLSIRGCPGINCEGIRLSVICVVGNLCLSLTQVLIRYIDIIDSSWHIHPNLPKNFRRSLNSWRFFSYCWQLVITFLPVIYCKFRDLGDGAAEKTNHEMLEVFPTLVQRKMACSRFGRARNAVWWIGMIRSSPWTTRPVPWRRWHVAKTNIHLNANTTKVAGNFFVGFGSERWQGEIWNERFKI